MGFLIDEQLRGASFPDAAAVVGEYHPNDVVTRCQRLRRLHLELMFRLIGERVCKRWLAIQHEERPTTKAAAYGRDHAVRTAFGNGDLGSDGPRFVLEVWC